jgi:hypothetical protein
MEIGYEAGRRTEVVLNDVQCQALILTVLNLSVLLPERLTAYSSSSFPLSDDS